MAADAERPAIDDALFPPSFLRLLTMVPAAVRRLHAGVADGQRAMPGEGGRFFFRGHRPYRPGDDLRRIDWNVYARRGTLLVREFDAERDVRTEVWLDGSASMGPFGGRVASARAAALACAAGLGAGGRVLLGCLRDGQARPLLEAAEAGRMHELLEAISRDEPQGRADLALGLEQLVRRVARGARLVLVSDLLTRAHPGVLHVLAGRGVRGALFHLRVPQVIAPRPGTLVRAHDVETAREATVRLDAAGAARVSSRARAHAARWAHHCRLVGLRYLPFRPALAPEDLLRRIVLEVP